MTTHFRRKISTVFKFVLLLTLQWNFSFASNYIDAQVAGKGQIIAALQTSQAGTLHFVSHGRTGELLVDGHWLNAQKLAELLNTHLQKDHSIKKVNIYGCEFGKGTEGKAAVSYLEQVLNVRIAASDDITGLDGDWELEVGSASQHIERLDDYPFSLQYAPNDDFDGDGINNSLDLDDDNDGILDSEESIPTSEVCSIHSPNSASSSVASSGTIFPASRPLSYTYDNNLGTYGGTSNGTVQLIGTITYTYNTPLNDVTEFQFFSNGGNQLNDGQVTNIASIKFYNNTNQVLYQVDNVIIPQASVVTPYVLSFPTPLQGVVSFTLTDLTDQTHGGSSEAIWKEVNLKTCVTSDGDIDTDNDGIANRFDLDSDGDGCPDSQEASVVLSFPQIPYASSNIANTGGTEPAVLSQINLSTFMDLNSNGFDDRLEITTDGFYSGTYTYSKATNASEAECLRDLDSDGDGIPDSIDIDDDNDGILDTAESAAVTDCNLHYPNSATSSIASSATVFPAGRELINTYDNDADTYGGTEIGTAQLVGTITYTYNTPLNNVGEFQFFSNGGSVLTDGQVTNIAAVKFYDSADNLLYQADNLVIPQASVSTPYVISFPIPLHDVASFTLTDLSDETHGSLSEAIWKNVNLKTCLPPADLDTDQDGIVNRLDLDSDGDGCPDSQEAGVVAGFANIEYSNINVSNINGDSPALASQISSATFLDQNSNGFDDRLETVTTGAYTGNYTYEQALDNTNADCTPLPVTLISFTAKLSTEGNVLQWETAQEKDFDGFSIERSSDLTIGFKNIGSIKGGLNRYNFTDVMASKGNNYYRLKMIDRDGSSDYSRIIHLYRSYGENEHTIFPNPGIKHTVFIHNYFTIESVKVFDTMGNVIKVKTTECTDQYQFDIDTNASPGIYILQYRVGSNLIRRKFSLN